MKTEGRRYLVTGGTGFIGSALVRALVERGARVRVFDNNFRGKTNRLSEVLDRIELAEGDIRDYDAVQKAVQGVDGVLHLAYINGTELFYQVPELVMEVAIKGMMHVMDACRQHSVGELILASSSEVYQTPPRVPTDESAPLVVPDVMNPRFSYGGGKIACELMLMNMGRKILQRALIFRPHNVYGPNMGHEHVIPQFIERLQALSARIKTGPIDFPIQGSGAETRAFIYIDDFIDGLVRVLERGEHLNLYHVGTQEEVSIRALAQEVARALGREIRVVPGDLRKGSTPRRCPDISKVAALGFSPKVSLAEGIRRTARAYLKEE